MHKGIITLRYTPVKMSAHVCSPIKTGNGMISGDLVSRIKITANLA